MMNTASGAITRRCSAASGRLRQVSKRPISIHGSSFRFLSTSRTTNNNNGNNNDSKTKHSQQQHHPNPNHHQAQVQQQHPILKPGFQPTGISKDGVYLGSTFLMLSPHTLPELDVSALLHTTVYTRKVGSSINGNDAAMRLTKAKKELQEIIHHELGEPLSSNSSGSSNHKPSTRNFSANSVRAASSSSSYGNNSNVGGVKKMYLMRRHGVPNQLLQHFLTAADGWLTQKSALELWFDSSCQGSLSVLTTEGASWRTLRPTDWDDAVTLYLAAMKRMVSHMATMTPFLCSDDSQQQQRAAALLSSSDIVLEWKTSISRHNKLPLTLFPNDPEIFPVIEWILPPPPSTTNGNHETLTSRMIVDETTTSTSNINNNNTTGMIQSTKAPRIGKIVIRLQGALHPDDSIPRDENYVKQSHDVSLIFEANFDVANTVLTTTTTAATVLADED